MASVLINIDVPDIQKATQFYVNAFSLKIGRRFNDDAVELLGLEAPIFLLKKSVGSKPFAQAKSTRNYDRHWSPVHLDIVVPAIDSALESAIRAGAKVENSVTAKKWGKIAMLSDPFGNGFCLIEFVGRGYDEVATCQHE